MVAAKGFVPGLTTIVVKTLNEERNIERTLNSIAVAAEGLDLEIIVADSLSTDRTAALAWQLGATVVQLKSAADRSCGVGAQLGFVEAAGEYIMILDGDMELVPGFLQRSLSLLMSRPDLAGVGGQLQEMNTQNRVFINRLERNSSLRAVGPVDRLDGGGLYRAAAIHDVGYFTHRGLHSCEELELGCRLSAAGWRLWRIEAPSVRHLGHSLPRYSLLWRRVKSRYVLGPGELIRSALGRPWIGRVMSAYRAYLAMPVIWLMFFLAIMLLRLSPWPLVAVAIVVVGIVVRSAAQRGSFSDAIYAFVAWNVFAVGLICGFLRWLPEPTADIGRTVRRSARSRSCLAAAETNV